MEKVTGGQENEMPHSQAVPVTAGRTGEQWCIAAVPGAAWARKVFPGMRTSTAMEKLWEAILFTSG